MFSGILGRPLCLYTLNPVLQLFERYSFYSHNKDEQLEMQLLRFTQLVRGGVSIQLQSDNRHHSFYAISGPLFYGKVLNNT